MTTPENKNKTKTLDRAPLQAYFLEALVGRNTLLGRVTKYGWRLFRLVGRDTRRSKVQIIDIQVLHQNGKKYMRMTAASQWHQLLWGKMSNRSAWRGEWTSLLRYLIDTPDSFPCSSSDEFMHLVPLPHFLPEVSSVHSFKPET